MAGEAGEETAPLAISGGAFAADLAPKAGGRVARLRHAGRDLLAPLPAWPDQPRRWPRGGAYPLIPYSNRIRDARLAFAGKVYAVAAHPDALPHALHGPAHLDRWNATDVATDSAILALDRPADAHWPWPVRATQRFSCERAVFSVTLTLENAGATAMPAGLGWHPYFVFPAGAAIRHDARLIWAIDAQFLPTRRHEAIDGGAAPAEGTFYLSDWRAVDLDLGAAGRFRLTADPLFSHLVLHRPAGGAYYCVEPVSHLADAFNLADEGFPGTGARSLAPGERLEGAIRLEALSAGSDS